MPEPSVFDATDSRCWTSRGRLPVHAALIAAAWRDYPDLAPTAPLEERMARTRARVAVMRPVHDAIALETERARQSTNFAFTEAGLARGQGDDRDIAILRGRDADGFDWDRSVHFAYGWYAAHAGWEARPLHDFRADRADALRRAYDLGFREGGGVPEDLFDTARRALLAATRLSNQAPASAGPVSGRRLPSIWPRPTDAPRPTPWQRRLMIVEGRDMAGSSSAARAIDQFRGDAFDLLRGHAAAATATIVILSPAYGFLLASDTVESRPAAMTPERAADLAGDPQQRARLQNFLADGDYDDVLVVANDVYLAILDAHAAALPLCRSMERTRNTPLQQQAHLKIWLDRGLSSGETKGSGHIRWGKLARGLTGRLGEFTGRYHGRTAAGGHLIVIEQPDATPARGFMTPAGEPLDPEIVISNRRDARSVMARSLRAFAGAVAMPLNAPGA